MAATIALTTEQVAEIISTIQTGMTGIRPNPRIAMALRLEAELGLRIGDIVQLRLVDIIRDGSRYRLDIIEEKTDKRRTFTVPDTLYCIIRDYADAQGIAKTDRLFPFTVRAVQKHLAKVCDLLELENVSTHSFRKWCFTKYYEDNGHDIVLTQKMAQHSTAAITQRYIGIEPERMEQAIAKHALLLQDALDATEKP